MEKRIYGALYFFLSPVKLGNSKMKFINLEMLKLKAR